METSLPIQMKTKSKGNLSRATKALLALLVIGVWGLLLTLLFQERSVEAQGKPKEQVTKWEYAVAAETVSTKTLNSLGNEGWELVTVSPTSQAVLKCRR